MRDLRLLAFDAIRDLTRDERDAARDVELRRPSSDQAADAYINRVALVWMREDSARMRVRVIVDVVGAAYREVHGKSMSLVCVAG